MNIQIFGTKKCKTTQKAIRFFKERGIKIHFVDLNEKGLSKGELNNIGRCVPPEDLIDREGKEFKKSNLVYMDFDIMEKLFENSLLLKTPIVRNGNKSTVGECPSEWKSWFND